MSLTGSSSFAVETAGQGN